MLSKEQIKQIVDSNEIVQTISKYVDLKREGRNYKGLCPFHNDSHASMSVSPEKQWFKCFSCNESGNSLSFIQKKENISFPEALKIGSENANLSFKELTEWNTLKTKYTDDEIKIFEINKAAALFYRNNLSVEGTEQVNAKEYLKTARELSLEDLEKFQIGFADSDNQKLSTFLEKKGFTHLEMNLAGLIRASYDGQSHKDVFSRRIMFPISDKEGNIIGFSGRSVGPSIEGIPKYLNTTETNIFKKSELMYNINNSASDIKKNGEVIILEGFMDAIALSKVGINNTVALMGTSLSDYHIKEISKLTKNCTVFMDGDKPGMDATLKISKHLLDSDLTVNVVNNTTEKDPDELVQSKTDISEMLENKLHPLSWLMQRTKNAYDLSDYNNAKKYIYAVGNVMLSVKDQTTKEFYLNNLSKETGMSREMVNDVLGFKTNSLSTNQQVITPVAIKNSIQNNGNFNEKYSTVILKDYNIRAESAGGVERTTKDGAKYKTEPSFFVRIPSFTHNDSIVEDYGIWVSKSYVHELTDKNGNIKTNDPRKEYVLKNNQDYTAKFINTNRTSDSKPDIKIPGAELAQILKSRQEKETLDYQNYKNGLKQNSPENTKKEQEQETKKYEQVTMPHSIGR